MKKTRITITRSLVTGKCGDVIDAAVAVANAERMSPSEAACLMIIESPRFRRLKHGRKKKNAMNPHSNIPCFFVWFAASY